MTTTQTNQTNQTKKLSLAAAVAAIAVIAAIALALASICACAGRGDANETSAPIGAGDTLLSTEQPTEQPATDREPGAGEQAAEQAAAEQPALQTAESSANQAADQAAAQGDGIAAAQGDVPTAAQTTAPAELQTSESAAAQTTEPTVAQGDGLASSPGENETSSAPSAAGDGEEEIAEIIAALASELAVLAAAQSAESGGAEAGGGEGVKPGAAAVEGADPGAGDSADPGANQGAGPGAAAGVVTVSFEYVKQSGSASNQFAVWIEDMDGRLVKTLYATRYTANGGYKNRPDSIALWVGRSGLASMDKGDVDAITGATPKAGELSYAWALDDTDGGKVAPGEYRFIVEGTLRWKNYVLYSGVIAVGGAPNMAYAEAKFTYEGSGRQPALSGTSPENSMIGPVTATYTP